MKFNYNVINIGDFVLANSKRSLLFVEKIVEKDSNGLTATFVERLQEEEEERGQVLR